MSTLVNAQELDVAQLWKRNRDRPWVQHLRDKFVRETLSGEALSKDSETIRYWIAEFAKGTDSCIVTDREHTVTDGLHRLVAAKIIGKAVIHALVCPQKSTYGR